MTRPSVESFIRSLLASQEQNEKAGIKISKIKKEDLVGLVFIDGELIMIHEEDLEKFDF